MLRIWLVAAMALGAGCAGDDDLDPTAPELHDLGTCDADWMSGLTDCERACHDVHDVKPDLGPAPACHARFTGTRGTEQPRNCSDAGIFEYRGVLGCCAYDTEHLDNGSVPVRFAVCDEQ